MPMQQRKGKMWNNGVDYFTFTFIVFKQYHTHGGGDFAEL